MAEMTEAQRAAFEAALSRSKAKQQKREEVPTQRLRALGQGLTFGTADEIEARARSLTSGRPYEEVLDEIRGGLKAYKEARPIESTAYEIGGAAIPALIPGGQSSLVRAAGRAALEGGAYAFGTGEGGFEERIARVPGGAALGGVAGGAGFAATRALTGAGKVTARTLRDAGRRVLGSRGGQAVEAEIQRLAQQTGKTADEIAADIAGGRLMAENQTVRAAVRALRAQGGDATRIIQEGLEGRPEATRAAAMQQMRDYLAEAGTGSQAARRAASEEATRAAERQSYGALAGREAPEDVIDALKDTLRRVPSASKEVEIRLQAQTGQKPFYEITEEGDVVFSRTPTIDEAEAIRRAVNNRASALFRSESMGGAGEAVAGVESELRSVLDFSIPELASTRAQAAAVRANRDAYEAGQKALVGDVNEKMVDFAKLSQGEGSEEAVAAYRAGLMQALEARAATGSRQSMFRNFTNPETKEGVVLREVFPQDQLDDVLRGINIAKESEATQQFVMGGPSTSDTLLEASRQGMGLTAADLTGIAAGSPEAIMNVSGKLVQSITRGNLNDRQRAQVAEILVSQNPDLVRRAIQDDSAMAQLGELIGRIADRVVAGSRAGAAMQAGIAGGEATGGMMQGLLGGEMPR